MAPTKEIMARTQSNFDSREKRKNEIRIMGKSVIRGERATFMPSVLLCFKVCVRTRVRRGPGDTPEDSPNKEPRKRK
jgi:hypothetical protein